MFNRSVGDKYPQKDRHGTSVPIPNERGISVSFHFRSFGFSIKELPSHYFDDLLLASICWWLFWLLSKAIV